MIQYDIIEKDKNDFEEIQQTSCWRGENGFCSWREECIQVSNLWKKKSQKGNMNNHMASVHEGIKAFKCHICHYGCSQKVILDKHMVSVHEEGNILTVWQNVFLQTESEQNSSWRK